MKTFSSTIGNTSGAASTAILIPSYAPSDPGNVIKSGQIYNGEILEPGNGEFGATRFRAANLTGGSGTGARGYFRLFGDHVAGVSFLFRANGGKNYLPGDVLSAAPADIDNIVGFTYQVNKVSEATSSIEDFHTFIKENPTRVKAIKIVTNNAEQLAQSINILPKDAFKSKESRQIHLALYTTEKARNPKIITIDDVDLQLDNDTEINVIIPDATTTTFTFVLGESFNAAEILNKEAQ